MAFEAVELFGGAIAVTLPNNFADVSQIRQVPDNQEVFLEQDGFTSVTVDILEHVDKPDIDALEYHLKDITEDDADKVKIISSSTSHFSKLPTGTTALSLIAVSPPDEQQKGRQLEPDHIVIYLTLVRLPDKKTDILVIINVPFIKGQYDPDSVNIDASQFGQLGATAQAVRDKILQTFEIKDWSLFVNDDTEE